MPQLPGDAASRVALSLFVGSGDECSWCRGSAFCASRREGCHIGWRCNPLSVTPSYARDGEDLPAPRYALEIMETPINERNARPSHQVRDCFGNKYFVRCGQPLNS
jgi:hypothetical protein